MKIKFNFLFFAILIFFNLIPIVNFHYNEKLQALPFANGNENWYIFETKHFRIIYPKKNKFFAINSAKLFEKIHLEFEGKYKKLWLNYKTNVVLNFSSDQFQGLTNVLYDNFIILYLENPEIGTFARYESWLEDLFRHEYVHVLSLQIWDFKTSFWFRLILGVPPNLNNSRAFSEGIATYEESQKGHGRLFDPISEMAYRTAILEKSYPTLAEILNNTHRWPTGNVQYIYGARLFDKLAKKKGGDAPRNFWNNYNLYPQSRLKNLGTTYYELYNGIKESDEKRFAIIFEKLKNEGLTKYKRLTNDGFVKKFLYYSEKENALLFFARPSNDISGIYKLKINYSNTKSNNKQYNKKELIQHQFINTGIVWEEELKISSSDYLLYHDTGLRLELFDLTKNYYNSKLEFSENSDLDLNKRKIQYKVQNKTQNKSQNKDISKSQNKDISKSQNKDISKSQNKDISKSQNKDISKSQNKDLSKSYPFYNKINKRLYFIEHDYFFRSLKSVSKLNNKYHDEKTYFKVPYTGILQYINISPNGKFLSTIYRENDLGHPKILLCNINDDELEKCKIVVTHEKASLTQVSFSHDSNELYFVSDVDGIFNIYSYNLKNKNIYKKTNILTGLFYPVSTKNFLYAIAYFANGYDIVSIENKDLKNELVIFLKSGGVEKNHLNVGVPTFSENTKSGSVGENHLNVGVPTFSENTKSGSVGENHLNVGVPTFSENTKSGSVGENHLNVGVPTFSEKDKNGSVGENQLNVGVPTFSEKDKNGSVGENQLNVGVPTFSEKDKSGGVDEKNKEDEIIKELNKEFYTIKEKEYFSYKYFKPYFGFSLDNLSKSNLLDLVLGLNDPMAWHNIVMGISFNYDSRVGAPLFFNYTYDRYSNGITLNYTRSFSLNKDNQIAAIATSKNIYGNYNYPSRFLNLALNYGIENTEFLSSSTYNLLNLSLNLTLAKYHTFIESISPEKGWAFNFSGKYFMGPFSYLKTNSNNEKINLDYEEVASGFDFYIPSFSQNHVNYIGLKNTNFFGRDANLRFKTIYYPIRNTDPLTLFWNNNFIFTFEYRLPLLWFSRSYFNKYPFLFLKDINIALFADYLKLYTGKTNNPSYDSYDYGIRFSIQNIFAYIIPTFTDFNFSISKGKNSDTLFQFSFLIFAFNKKLNNTTQVKDDIIFDSQRPSKLYNNDFLNSNKTFIKPDLIQR